MLNIISMRGNTGAIYCSFNELYIILLFYNKIRWISRTCLYTQCTTIILMRGSTGAIYWSFNELDTILLFYNKIWILKFSVNLLSVHSHYVYVYFGRIYTS